MKNGIDVSDFDGKSAMAVRILESGPDSSQPRGPALRTIQAKRARISKIRTNPGLHFPDRLFQCGVRLVERGPGDGLGIRVVFPKAYDAAAVENCVAGEVGDASDFDTVLVALDQGFEVVAGDQALQVAAQENDTVDRTDQRIAGLARRLK